MGLSGSQEGVLAGVCASQKGVLAPLRKGS